MTPDTKCHRCGSERYVNLWHESGRFRGWYCVDCNTIEKPIGRERLFRWTDEAINRKSTASH